VKKLASILLSLLVLVSSTGFTVANHYCGGQMVKAKLMYVQNDLDCGMNSMLNGCDKHEEVFGTILKKKCCENEFSKYQIENQLKTSELQTPINTEMIVLFVYVYTNLFIPNSKEDVIPSDYSPPPYIRDIPLLHQVFLI
jgi:hypothetical protein